MSGRANTTSIRLICFDLGGVLMRICRDWPEAVAAAGLSHRDSLNGGTLEFNHAHHLTVALGKGEITIDEFSSSVSALLDHRYSADEVCRIHHAVLLDPYEGVASLIDGIHARGFMTACLSNTNHAHWSRLLKFPVVKSLHHRLASHELGLHKPEPAIYHELERRVGVTGPGIVFFDDLLENVQAAREIGWDAVHIDHAGSTAAQMEVALRSRAVLPPCE